MSKAHQSLDLLAARLAALPPDFSLKRGAHANLEEGACAMELASYLAGQSFSDHPPCVSPVLGVFMRSWNDSLPTDSDRTRLLLPIVPRVLGTTARNTIEQRRGFMAADWLIRTWTPKWLELVPSLQPDADNLRALPEIADIAHLVAATTQLRVAATDANTAQTATQTAARAAAWGAARAASWAARAAAWAAGAASWAAWAASWAAGAAALDAAWAASWAAGAAARAAAWGAAWGAAFNKLKPTTEWLQASTVDLVDRMIALSEHNQGAPP